MEDSESVKAAYSEQLTDYQEVLNVTLELSANQHGIHTDGRGLRAMKIFTRQTLVAISLSKLLPFSRGKKESDDGFWDVCSIASLARNLMEGYVAVFYAGTESISELEAELRFLLGQHHRNREWLYVRKRQRPDDPEISRIESGLSAQMKRLKEHAFLPRLSLAQRNKVLKGDEMYLTKADVEARSPVAQNYRLYYQLLSNLVHPLPLSIERIDDDRGRGVGSESDISYVCLCLSLATRYLAGSVLAIGQRFPELEARVNEPLEKLRRFCI